MKNSIFKLSCATIALLFVASCSSSGDGGSGTAVNPVAAVSSSNAALGDGSTAQFDGDSKTVTYAGTTYKFSTDPKSTASSHISDNNELLIFHPTKTLNHTSIPIYLTGKDFGSSTATVSDGGIALLGDLTPVADLPTSKVDYSGDWFAIVVEKDSSGQAVPGEPTAGPGNGFTATADFGAAQNVTGRLDGGDGSFFDLKDANISGNTFTGKLKHSNPLTPEVATNGGFFGPSADEIAGTSEAFQEPSQSGGTFTSTIGYYGSKEVPDS